MTSPPRPVAALLAALLLDACTCRAYVDVFYADAAATYAGQVVAMVGDTVPLRAQAQKYHGDGECRDGGKLLGPGSASRPTDYSWASSVPAVVRPLPSGGLVAVSAGRAVITASYTRDAAEDFAVNVEVIPRIDSVTIAPRATSVAAGDTVSFLISEWAGGTRLPVRFPGVIDPHLREQNDSAYYTVNMIRVDPARVMLLGQRPGTARLHAWSLTWNYAKVPQDTATLVIVAP